MIDEFGFGFFSTKGKETWQTTNYFGYPNKYD